MEYRGFEITAGRYIDERHPQYNRLSFTAKDGQKYIDAVFHDLDTRVKSEEELMEIFMKRIDDFIEDTTKQLTNMDKKRIDFVEDYINSHFKTFMSDADAAEVTQAILLNIVRDMDDNSESGINCDDIDAALTRMIKSKFCK